MWGTSIPPARKAGGMQTSCLLAQYLPIRSKNGTVKLETIGRGKAVLRWLERMQGKKLLQLVGE
jgi:hypothetical protein